MTIGAFLGALLSVAGCGRPWIGERGSSGVCRNLSLGKGGGRNGTGLDHPKGKKAFTTEFVTCCNIAST